MTKAALTRNQAWEFALSQLRGEAPSANKNSCWHYGKCEIKQLLGAIYGPPELKEQKWRCPIGFPGCEKNCGNYGCGN